MITIMDFVALLSGGKDSCYNIYLSIQHGYRLACVANLHPPEEGEHELNSFMYQSAGSTLIPAIADCLGVPLIRKPIKRLASDQTLEYTASDNTEDEVEDLYELLAQVQQEYPSVRAVSVGAIVSNYQRHRVEAVCQRLGLVVLSYLWQRDRKELIREIVDKGFECILVKVAGAGLEPHKHLNKRISDLLPTLFKYHSLYGLDVCGEGGEYESLVLDGPIFKRRIHVDQCKVVLDQEDESVGNLHITSYRVLDKEAAESLVHTIDYNALLLDTVQSMELVYPSEETLDITANSVANPTPASSVPMVSSSSNSYLSCDSSGLGSSSVIYSSLMYNSSSSSTGDMDDAFRSQFSDIMAVLHGLLAQQPCSVDLLDVVYVHVYVSSMKLFGVLNDVYAKHFQQFHPPSRSCIEACLPHGKLVALDVAFLRGSFQQALKNRYVRDVLHVKSVSAWAPQCIGPYAQANTIHNSLVYVAGQIPLIPGTMQLPDIPTSLTTSNNPYRALAADLYMCLANIHGILTAYNGVGDGVYANSVFDSVLCMVVYVNASNVHICDGLYDFILQTLHACMKHIANIQTKKAKVHSASDNSNDHDGYDDDEDLHEEVKDDESNMHQSQLVVNMVCVSNLPRSARVECEAVALKPDVFPAHLLKFTEWDRAHQAGTINQQAGDKNTVLPTATPCDYFDLPLERWDIWNVDDSLPPTHSALNAMASPSPSLSASYSQMDCRYSVRYHTNCIAAISITMASLLDCVLADVDSVQNVVRNLSGIIQDVCRLTLVPLTYIQTIRCFVPIHTNAHPSELVYHMQRALSAHLQQHMKILPAVICVPVVSVLGQACMPVLSAQIVLVDLQQIETELWVARER